MEPIGLLEQLELAEKNTDFETLENCADSLLKLDPRNVNWMTYKYKALAGLGKLQNNLGFLRKFCFYNSLDSKVYFDLYTAYKSEHKIYESIISLVYGLSCPEPKVECQEVLDKELYSLGFSSVKLVFLHVERVGHLGLEPDVWMRQSIQEKPEQECLHIVISSGKYANQCLKQMINQALPKKNVCIVDNEYWYSFHSTRPNLLIDKHYKSMPFDINSVVRGSDAMAMYGKALNAFKNSESVMKFPSSKVGVMRSVLADRGIVNFDKIVCYHVRDSDYLTKAMPDRDFSYHSSRNMSIDKYSLAIDALLDKGFTVIRLGKYSNQSLDVANKNYFDLCVDRDYEHGDDIEMYLLSVCRFFLGNNSGMVYASSIFDTPTLAVNMTPFFHLASRNTRVIPKLFFDKEGDAIKFIDILEGKTFNYKGNEIKMIDHHSHSDDYETDGIYAVENDEVDIRDSVEEFLELLESGSFDDIKTERQRKYSESIPEGIWFKSSDGVVSDSFIRRHAKLFELEDYK
jgi:putative glycosyltransferase (TIGR04372 family)